MKQNEIRLVESRLQAAREKLQRVWEARGRTDDLVLKAGAEFDAVYNEYRRLLWEMEKAGNGE